MCQNAFCGWDYALRLAALLIKNILTDQSLKVNSTGLLPIKFLIN